MSELLHKAKQEQNGYRPLPFWSWNDELDEQRLRWQVRQMHKAGLGGFFMHARVGLKTPYMQEQWFRCVKGCIEEALELGMEPWGYDENGYPSGIADGQVCRESEDYRATWIELMPVNSHDDYKGRRVAACYEKGENGWVRVAKEDFSGVGMVAHIKNEMRAADPMNAKAVKRFLELTHEKYKQELGEDFGKRMPGYFTDEPQLKQYQLPWSCDFDKTFLAAYGYDLLDRLPALKDDAIAGYQAVRHDYWMLINKLYCESFAKQIHQWCEENHCQFTGHIMGEDTILEQMGSNGGAMAFYPHMDMPGMDWLGRRVGTPLAPKQVSSVAAQVGQQKVLSETFALSGWDVSFADLKWMAQWQMANGINRLCPHLESYSIRGIRKRDYPASLFVQEPWWQQFGAFTDYISALGSVLGNSQEECDVLVVHPLHTAHVRYNGSSKCEGVRALDDHFAKLSIDLQEQHIPYHYGDEVVMADYGSVEGNALKVGKMSYRWVLLPEMDNILSSTLDLLEKFAAGGGKICCAGKLPHLVDGRESDRITKLSVEKLPKNGWKAFFGGNAQLLSIAQDGKECPQVLSTIRCCGNERLYFMVNLDRENAYNVMISCADNGNISSVLLPQWQLQAVESTAEGFAYTLNPGESLLLINKTSAAAENTVGDVVELKLPDTMTISASDPNKLTLDAAEYAVGNGDWQPSVPLIRLQKQLMDVQTDDIVKLRFGFEIDMTSLPESLQLVSENIPEFALRVNGQMVDTTNAGWYLDPDFAKVEISSYLKHGHNEIELEGRFYQRKELYDFLYREKDLSSNFYAVDFEFESVTYDVELESIYLMGDFCVDTPAPYEPGKRRARFNDGPFRLTDARKTLHTGDVTCQGYPFFAGNMDLEFKLNLDKKAGARYILAEPKPDCPVAELLVNGKHCDMLQWEPVRPDMTDLLCDGENTITLRLHSGLRNLLGPHHYLHGESYYVGVSTFGDWPGWCEDVEGVSGYIWNDRWCFVTFGPGEKQNDLQEDET